MGLHQVALVLEVDHLGAHGGGRDVDAGHLGHVPDPTGWAVPMYSVTTASKMAAWRSSRARCAMGS